MSGIVIGINPIIAQVGPFELAWHAVLSMLAVLAAVLITGRLAKQKGIATEEIYSLAIWAIAGGIIGARLFHVLDHLGYYAANPGQILQIQLGGLAIWGALIGGAVATIPYARLKGLPLARLVDVLAPALLVAQIIGRIGCTINGDAWGGITSLPWGFIYTNPNDLIPVNLLGVPTHPYPVYEMIWNGIVLLVIWQLGRAFKKDGMKFMTYIALYSIGRFFLTFVRQETVLFWGLQEAQVVGLVGLAFSACALLYLSLQQPLPERPSQP